MKKIEWSLGPGKGGVVSIIVTAFNQEHYLRGALESILNQQYRPIECVVVNDGSTDGTQKVVEECAAKAPEGLTVKYIYQHNQGPQAARNRGVRESCGEFIQYLDGDDLLEKTKLAKEVEFLTSAAGQNFGVAYGDAQWLFEDEEGDRLGQVIGVGPTDDFVVSMLEGHWSPNFAFLCRRSAVERCGPWDPAIGINQDYEYFLRMGCKGARYGYVPCLTGFYRKHSRARISDQGMLKRARTTLQILKGIEQLVSTEDSVTSKRREALAIAYKRVSYWTFKLDREVWKESLDRAVRLNPQLKAEKFPGWILQPFLGVQRTERVLGTLRHWKQLSLDCFHRRDALAPVKKQGV